MSNAAGSASAREKGRVSRQARSNTSTEACHNATVATCVTALVRADSNRMLHKTYNHEMSVSEAVSRQAL